MKKTLYILLLTLSTVGFSTSKRHQLYSHPYWLYFLWQTIWIRKCNINRWKIGFGFGEYVETAVYLQSLGLKTSFSDFGIAGYNEAQFQPQDLNNPQFKTNLEEGDLFLI
jgi:hypothetical protein